VRTRPTSLLRQAPACDFQIYDKPAHFPYTVEAKRLSPPDTTFDLPIFHDKFWSLPVRPPQIMSSSDTDFVGIFELLFHPTTWASRVHFSRGTTVVLLACSAFTITCTGVVGFVTLVAFAKLIDWLDPIIECKMFGATTRGEDESSESLPPCKSVSFAPDIEFGYIDHRAYATFG
jgi:hypothetical protein